MKESNSVNTFLSTIGSALGITIAFQDVYTVLGIIITILNISVVVYNMIYRIIQHVKKKEYDQIDDEIQNASDDLTKMKDGNIHEDTK